MIRARMRMKPSDFNAALNAIDAPPSNTNKIEQDELMPTNAPIKLIKKTNQYNPNSNNISNMTQQQRSLQKQISAAEMYIGVSPTTSRLNQIETFSKNITLGNYKNIFFPQCTIKTKFLEITNFDFS